MGWCFFTWCQSKFKCVNSVFFSIWNFSSVALPFYCLCNILKWCGNHKFSYLPYVPYCWLRLDRISTRSTLIWIHFTWKTFKIYFPRSKIMPVQKPETRVVWKYNLIWNESLFTKSKVLLITVHITVSSLSKMCEIMWNDNKTQFYSCWISKYIYYTYRSS